MLMFLCFAYLVCFYSNLQHGLSTIVHVTEIIHFVEIKTSCNHQILKQFATNMSLFNFGFSGCAVHSYIHYVH